MGSFTVDSVDLMRLQRIIYVISVVCAAIVS